MNNNSIYKKKNEKKYSMYNTLLSLHKSVSPLEGLFQRDKATDTREIDITYQFSQPQQPHLVSI